MRILSQGANEGPRHFLWRVVALLLAGSATAFWLSVAGPVVRESDQASILAGAVLLSKHGGGDQNFYSYARQVGTYHALAGVLGVVDKLAPDASPSAFRYLHVGNIFTALLFGIALLIYASSVKSSLETLGLLLFATTPCVFLSAFFVSSNLFSLAVLCLFLVVWNPGSSHWKGYFVSAFLFFVAVAMRGDAILLLPILFVIGAKNVSFLAIFARPCMWGIALAGFLAIGLGEYLKSNSWTTVYSPFFVPKQVIGYLVFGLGVPFFVLCGISLTIVRKHIRTPLFALTAAGSVFVPLAFYLPQFFTPRHCILSAFVLLLLFRQGKWLWSGRWLGTRCTSGFGWGIAGLALVPLLLGVKLPRWDSPSLAWVGESYPTTDGFWPMGGMVGFSLKLSQAKSAPLDHNQEVMAGIENWMQSAEWNGTMWRWGRMRPLAFLAFAARKVEFVSMMHGFGKHGDAVIEWRQWATGGAKTSQELKNEGDIDCQWIQESRPGEDALPALMRFRAGLPEVSGPFPEPEEILALRDAFSGDDFRVLQSDLVEIAGGYLLPENGNTHSQNRKQVIFSRSPFQLQVGANLLDSNRANVAFPLYWCEMPKDYSGEVKILSGTPALLATARLPRHMSRANY